MVGALSTAVDDVFHKKVCLTYSSSSENTKPEFDEKIKRFITVYSRDKLFDFVKNRRHPSFPTFKHKHGIPRPAKLKAKLKKHLQTMDDDFYTQEVHGV